MTFDEALALVYSAFKDVFKREPFAPSEKIIYGADSIAQKIKTRAGIEPVCTNSSSVRDIAQSIMDSKFNI